MDRTKSFWNLRDARALGGGEDAGRAGAAPIPAAAPHPHVDPPVSHPRWYRAPGSGRDPARDRPAGHPAQDLDVEATAEQVADHRANQRQGRRDLPGASLVGYTNAGKSSLLRALSGAEVFVEDRLFATLDTLTREVDVGGGYRFRLTRYPWGSCRKLPHHLVASFRATLEGGTGG